MRQIAEEIAEQKLAAIIPQIQAAALQQARDDLLRAFAVDVETVVEVAFANGEKIFRDKKTQKVIADSIMREIRKRLDHLAI
jgi:predicted metal-dependent phosphoesterase TrpH